MNQLGSEDVWLLWNVSSISTISVLKCRSYGPHLSAPLELLRENANAEALGTVGLPGSSAS